MKQMFLLLFTSVFLTAAFVSAQDITNDPSAVVADGTVINDIANVPQPPAWLDNVLAVGMKLPVVGPFLVQLMQWLGVIATVLTTLVTLILGGIQTLNVILKWAKLGDLAVKIIAFQNSNIMYWLKFFSIYNATKPQEKTEQKK